ncbi:MAG: cytochrome C [Gammaproteobacteria bacterium]|nr:cytochrome C [Gammaproteobacteria bacterium]
MAGEVMLVRRSRPLSALILAAGLLAGTPPALAVPSFARQTGMACEACHTVYPELTHFGRVFKANGYTLTNLKQVRGVNSKKDELLALSQTPPLSIMVMISDTQLQKSLPDVSNPAAPGLAQNGSAGFPQQVGLFYAGKIAPHLGAFLQLTYNNSSGSIGIDNTDLRFADTALLADNSPLTYGVSLNNNPTVQDLWNSTPAFGYPFTSSNTSVSPAANPAINGTFGGSVAGLTGYVFWNESLYAEAGGYRSAKQGAVNALTGATGPLDGTTSNVISGLAPYWRAAYEYNRERHTVEAGLYGINFNLFPGATSAGPAPLSGPTNRFKDVAQDLQYQFVSDDHQFSVLATRIHESMTLDASAAAGGSSAKDDLTLWRASGTYYFRRKIGGTLSYFSTTGSTDKLLYAAPAAGSPGVITSASGSPDTRGWMAELDYLPWLNVKLELQYTWYSKFNGGGNDYDGVGRNAADNNTLYLLLWLAY